MKLQKLRLIIFACVLFLATSVSGAQIFSDGFESGGLSGWSLSHAAGAVDWTASTTNPYSGSYHAFGRPIDTDDPACTMEKTTSTLGYNNINFSYYRKLNLGTSLHTFRAKWFDGIIWTSVENVTGTIADSNYSLKSFLLPSGADNNPGFAIKFECTEGTTSKDCNVDDVNITGTILDSIPPNIQISYPLNNTNSSNSALNINYTVGADAIACWYSNDTKTVNYSITCGQNITVVIWPEGQHNVTIWANDSNNNQNSSSVTFFIDITKPSVTLLTESPIDPAIYSSGQVYTFNATITDNNLNTILLEFNGANYTSSKNGNVYNVSLKDLSAGNYNYRWFANDSSGNINNTETGTYIINKAIISANLTSSKGWIYNYDNTATTVSYNEANTGDADIIYKIYRDNADKGSGETANLAAGTYNYIINTTGGQNYSLNSSLDVKTLIINKTSPISNMQISITPSNNVNYGTQTSATGSETNLGDSDLNYALYRNDTGLVSNPNIMTLNAGYYNYTYNTTGGQNYTNGTVSLILTVNKISNFVNLYLNNQENNLTIVYNQQINASAVSESSIVSLFRNGMGINSENSQNKILAAGYYEYKANSTGNQNYLANSTGKTFYVNVTKANSSILLYLNNSRSNITIGNSENIAINSTVQNGEGIIYVYINGTMIYSGQSPSYNLTSFFNAGTYNITTIYQETQNYTFSYETFWIKVLDINPPLINIISPEQKTYGINTSINLNYTISDAGGLGECWWNIDNGVNQSITCEQNTTFNATDGNHIIRLYANDSFGNLGFSDRNFSVLTSGPAINLIYPSNNSFLSHNENIYFNYSVSSGVGISGCQFLGNFNGTWGLNKTNNSIINENNFFFLNKLSEGTYRWGILCNDSQNRVNNLNFTFSIDIVVPNISITEPTGGKTNRNGIPLSFLIYDINLNRCWYNVYRGVNLEIENTTINCSGENSFNVTVDADFVLNLYANDSAGNMNFSSSNFNVDTSSPPTGGGGGGSSGGGGAGGGVVSPSNKTLAGKLELSPIESIIAHAQDKKTLSLNARNTGKIFLNNCRLTAVGDISSWFSSKQRVGISPGENVNFIFELNIPEDAKSGDFSLGLQVNCDEAREASSLGITIPVEYQLIKIKDIKQNGNVLNIFYDFDGSKAEEVNVELWVVDEFGAEIKRIEDKFSSNNNIVPRNVSIDFSKKLVGIYSVYAASSTDLTNSVKQSIILGKSSGTGFTVLDQPENKMIAYAVFLLIVGGGIFFIVWKSRKNNELEVKGKRKGSDKRDSDEDDDY